MDYSKLTPEQLLEMLRQGAPNLSNDMANIFSGEIYPENYPEILNSLRKGYDAGLMEDTYSDIASRFYDPETGEPANPGLSPADLVDYKYFVPGELNPFRNSFINETNNNPLGGGSFAYANAFPSDDYDSPVLKGWNFPAADSANAILANNRQIGDSDYTIDDLKANGMSDEYLLEFLRNLTNKGYKI